MTHIYKPSYKISVCPIDICGDLKWISLAQKSTRAGISKVGGTLVLSRNFRRF